MQVRSLEVSGLRSIQHVSLTFEDVTVLIGGNNAGKSTLLHALRLFFDAAPKVTVDDFYRREAEKIEITVIFDKLTDSEVQEFGTAVENGQLSITRTLSNDRDSNLTYSVRAKTFPEFRAVRTETNKTKRRTLYNSLADKVEGLQRAGNADEADAQMLAWEMGNPDKLESEVVRGFFGAANIANGKLRKKTNVHFIPAVANVSDETSDAKRSPIIGLLADIAKQTYENRQEVNKFIEDTQVGFGELVAPEKFPQLGAISENLTRTIQRYYSDSRLLADWAMDDGVRFSFPQPIIKIEDSGFLTGLEYVGHGLQRAALFSVIEFLAQSGTEVAEAEFVEPQSDIILLIEEPEIYQHPHKQKLVSDAFRRVCYEFNRSTGIRFQVVFATHSEKFVDIENFHTARIVRKESTDEGALHSVSALTIRKCSEYFADLVGKPPMPDHAFLAKLHIFSREVCEGFFAQKIILVEGVTDKAILEGVYRSMGRDNISEGIVIISVDGKTKMDKPFYIFNKLGIPTYAVFDSDASTKGKKARTSTNKLLQKIAEAKEPVDFPCGSFERFAAFEMNLEAYTKQICGDEFDKTFQSVADDLEMDISDVCKTPQAVCKVVDGLREQGTAFPLFEEIVGHVDGLTVCR
nr:AAA family ATPase [uncultured Cohaesibacter sp.]